MFLRLRAGQALLFRQKDPKPWSPGLVVWILKRRAESTGCATPFAQTVLAEVLDSAASLDHAAGDRKTIVLSEKGS